MPSRFARSLRGCNGENDASAQEPINSLLSSYGALPGGSNPQRKECEAAINHNTPFSYYLWGDAAELELFLSRRPDMRDEPWIGRTIMLEIASSIAEREVAVHGSANNIRVAVILTIILPPAHLAELQVLRAAPAVLYPQQRQRAAVALRMLQVSSGSAHCCEDLARASRYDGNLKA